MSRTKLDAPYTTFSIQGMLHDDDSIGVSTSQESPTSATTHDHATKSTASPASYPNDTNDRHYSGSIGPPENMKSVQVVGSSSSWSLEHEPPDSVTKQAKQGRFFASNDGPNKRGDELQSVSSSKDRASGRHNPKKGETSNTPNDESKDEMDSPNSKLAVQSRMLRAWKAWREKQGYEDTEIHIDPSISTIRYIPSDNQTFQTPSATKNSSVSRPVLSPGKTPDPMIEKAASPPFRIRKHLVDPHKDQPPRMKIHKNVTLRVRKSGLQEAKNRFR